MFLFFKDEVLINGFNSDVLLPLSPLDDSKKEILQDIFREKELYSSIFKVVSCG